VSAKRRVGNERTIRARMLREVTKHCLIRTDEGFECSCGERFADVYVSWDFAQSKWSDHIKELSNGKHRA
jgi:hypothetical protein